MKIKYIGIITFLVTFGFASLSAQAVRTGNTSVITNTHIDEHNTHSNHENHNHDHSNHHHEDCAHNHKIETKEFNLNINTGTLFLKDIHDLTVIAYDGNEVKFSAEVEVGNVPDRAKGLKLLSPSGLDDNTGFGVSVSKENGGATATQLSNDCQCNNITVQVPKGIKISIDNSSMNGNKVKVEGVSNEIEISTNYQDLYFKDITGPVSAKTVYGGIEATFSKVSQAGAISIYSVYGYVDVSIPSKSKGSFKLSAPYGEIYSNADIEIHKEGSMKTLTGNKVAGDVNGGGVDFSLKAAYGDVYLRQL